MASSPEEPQNHNQEHTRQTANPVGVGTSPQTNSPIKGAKLPNFPPGLEIHNYVIMNLLGRGGMGVVYRAHHKILDKDLAIKFLKTESVDERAWERFKLEAKTLGRLRHRNLVGIHDLGLFQDTFPYYVMDLLDGESLLDLVRRVGPLTEEEVVEIFIQAASGLACAHENGILHRDVKPANIVVTWAESNLSPVVKVVDFGLAKLVESNQSLTRTGEVNGSPLYMSPEQCEAGKLDERTDIYSLGCSIYEALTARVPFLGNSAFETMLMHQQDEPPTLAQQMPDLTFSPEIEAIIAKMLAKNKERRYQKMTQVIGDLRTLDAKNKRKLHPGKQTSAIKDQEEIEEELEQSKREKSAKFKIIAVCSFLGLLLTSVGGYFLYDLNQKQREQDALANRIEKVALIDKKMEALPQSQKAALSLNDQLKLLPRFKDKALSSGNKVVFNFPKILIGCLKIKEVNFDDLGTRAAQGTVTLETSSKIEFQPDKTMLNHPEIMEHFLKSDIKELNLSAVCDNANAFLEHARHLALSDISIEQPSKNLNLILLNDFTTVNDLTLAEIDTEALAKQPLVKRLHKLKILQPAKTVKLLNSLKSGSQLSSLSLTGTTTKYFPLEIGTLSAISALTALQELDLENTNLSSENLTALSSLSHIRTLGLANCRLDTKALSGLLKKLTELKELEIDITQLSESDLKILDARKVKIANKNYASMGLDQAAEAIYHFEP